MKKMVVFLLVFLSLSTFSAARRSQGIVTYSFQFNNFIQTKLNANEGEGTVKEKNNLPLFINPSFCCTVSWPHCANEKNDLLEC